MSGNETICSTVFRLFSDAYGSWKTICISRRNRRSSREETPKRSVDSKWTPPEVGSSSRSSSRASVDLPEPDSPTSPTVSPRLSTSETSSTALTMRRERGPPSRKCRLRWSTTTSGSPSRADSVRAAVTSVALTRRPPARGSGTPPPGAGRRPPAAAPRRRSPARRRSAGGTGSPDGSWCGRGGCPEIAAIGRSTSRSSPQIESSSASEYGCAGVPSTASALPLSTIRPAYMTWMSSQKDEARPRSCVIRIIPIRRSSTIRPSSSMIRACVVTSSAVVGSSAIRTSGFVQIAIAIITRWRIPPENWCG